MLGKQLRCLNDAIQGIASGYPVASAQGSSLKRNSLIEKIT
jgi:hypothetical protein